MADKDGYHPAADLSRFHDSLQEKWFSIRCFNSCNNCADWCENKTKSSLHLQYIYSVFNNLQHRGSWPQHKSKMVDHAGPVLTVYIALYVNEGIEI